MVLWFILALALGGLIVGALARLALPGPDPMSILATIALGIAGSFVGGIYFLCVSMAVSAIIIFLLRLERKQSRE